jgi:two-component system, chemotaxis family, CheB/CheR fusion protein
MAGEDNHDFESLLDFLKRQRGSDFTGYKRATLGRRVAKRMEVVGVEDHAEYLDYLQVHPDEFTELFNTLLINVTGFFRDPAAWRYLDEEVIPELLRRRPTGELRVWSAGCASGQEAYSIAMLLVRALGEKAFHERVKIYATDIDEEALAEARHAAYPPKELEAVPADLAERCFERTDHHCAFRRDLRRSVIFGRNDLIQDAPISRIDLLVCRNTLMYFTAETQGRILTRLNFALRDTGYLFLGKAEMLLTHSNLFEPVHLKCRIFSRVPRPTIRDRLAFVANGDPPLLADSDVGLRDSAFELGPVAQILVDRDGALGAANQQARTIFGLGRPDIGRPLRDLEISYRPVELRAGIEQAYLAKRAFNLGNVSWTSAGVERQFDVEVHPIIDGGSNIVGATITFDDVTEHIQLRDELERSKHELETAYEELQSTVEELETTNEELQSTNEELETTNEELQSTNEELETMNEELQSTNEELETMNDELRLRTSELDDVNASLETILGSLGVGVAVLDNNQLVRVWNAQADDLWGLRQEEAAGQHVLGLDIGLPVEELRDTVREALAGGAPPAVVLPAMNRRGRAIRCKVTAVPLSVDGHDLRGAILLMEALDETA